MTLLHLFEVLQTVFLHRQSGCPMHARLHTVVYACNSLADATDTQHGCCLIC